MTIKSRLLTLLSMFAALVLLVAACGEDTGDDTAEEDETEDTAGDDTEDEGAEDEGAEDEGAEDGDDGEASLEGEEIGIAWIPWEENIAVAHMWAAILEEEGANVSLSQYDVAPAFASVANGQEDLFMDMWLPGTHAEYQDEFGDQLEDYGPWFEEATLELTVPAYVDEVDSLEDLADNAELFDSRITGIEAGAGMMQILAEDVVPGYGLDEAGFQIQESSTAAMRSELQRAVDNEEPIVVTLWTPHPEYGLKDLKRLEDPQGLWGDAEQLHAVGRDGFSDDFPEVAEWIETWQMTDEELSDINAAIDEADEGEWMDVASTWVEENRDLVDGWLGR